MVRVRAGVRVIEGSSYRGQNYSDAGEIDFGSSKREFRVSEGSSYLESTVFRDDLVKVWRRWIVGDYEWNAMATFLL